MPRFHISPRTGSPAACQAEYRCPFGDLKKDHYDTPKDAQAAYEIKMNRLQFPTFNYGDLTVEPLARGMQLDRTAILIPKGVYALGTPESGLKRLDEISWNKWESVVRKTPGGLTKAAMGAMVNDYPVVALNVKSGPNTYYDNSGRDYHVKDNLITLTPVSLLKKIGASDDDIAKSYGSIVSFSEPTKITNHDGVISFGGDLRVNTNLNPIEDADVSDLD